MLLTTIIGLCALSSMGERSRGRGRRLDSEALSAELAASVRLVGDGVLGFF